MASNRLSRIGVPQDPHGNGAAVNHVRQNGLLTRPMAALCRSQTGIGSASGSRHVVVFSSWSK